MARSLRDLRRKIKGVKSTRQVTKAMELVAASKMRKAVQNAQMLRTYALTAWAILQKLALRNSGTHPWFVERPPRKILAVVISTDRGLCGNLNAHLFKTVAQYAKAAKQLPGFQSLEFIAVGRKAQQFLRRAGETVIGAFPAYSNHPKFRDILPMARMAIQGFDAASYDHVVLIYTDFLSPLVQEPVTKVLLPFSESRLKDMIDGMFTRKRISKEEERVMSQIEKPQSEYLFEPDEMQVLNRILPQLTEMQMYQATLESAASEHSARMVAMRNATDNATDIIDDLSLTYNQTRQANITAELSELSASKAALD
jgi:F-type H+-transporting ATPase subunit gamma